MAVSRRLASPPTEQILLAVGIHGWPVILAYRGPCISEDVADLRSDSLDDYLAARSRYPKYGIWIYDVSPRRIAGGHSPKYDYTDGNFRELGVDEWTELVDAGSLWKGK